MLSISKKTFNTPGVYKISINNKCYIGSSVCIYNRLMEHRSHLRNNKHVNKHLQSSYNKYGEDSLKIELLETCDLNLSIIRNLELNYILKYNPIFNKTTPITYVHSEETKIKISNTLKEKYFKGELVSPNKGKGIYVKVLNFKGETLFEKISLTEITKKLNYSNRSVIRLSLLRHNHLFKEHIIFKESENFNCTEWILRISGQKLPIYKIYENGNIIKCSNSSKEKIIKKLLNSIDFLYYSNKNKCYYTFIGNIIKCPFYKKL